MVLDPDNKESMLYLGAAAYASVPVFENTEDDEFKASLYYKLRHSHNNNTALPTTKTSSRKTQQKYQYSSIWGKNQKKKIFLSVILSAEKGLWPTVLLSYKQSNEMMCKCACVVCVHVYVCCVCVVCVVCM